jgi:hypothetical protein
MFIVASFSVASGLRTSMDKLADNFSVDSYVITDPGSSGLEYFSVDSLEPIYGRYAVGMFTEATALPDDLSVTVFSLENEWNVIGETLYVTGNDIFVGAELSLSGDVVLEGFQQANASVVGRYSSTVLPNDWVLGSTELLQQITGQPSGVCNFAVAKNLNSSMTVALENAGFDVQPMVGIIEFLDSGVSEIESDANWVLIPSAFVIAVLAYSFLGSETVDRRHDIGIVKTLGAGRRRVLGYLLLNALVISAYGGMLGVALGIVVSYALSTAASAVFTSVFIIESSEMLLFTSFLVTLAAGVLGALIPAIRMTFTSPVQDLKEVAPFS